MTNASTSSPPEPKPTPASGPTNISQNCTSTFPSKL
uniref:Uncharacterized protein n=1 Tax=Anguilla anguilla TaxID=7936 RepID=A0A0E9Q6N0_ANGAN